MPRDDLCALGKAVLRLFDHSVDTRKEEPRVLYALPCVLPCGYQALLRCLMLCTSDELLLRGFQAVFTLVPSTSKFSRILTSTSRSKFNLTPNWWAARNGPDHSLTSSKSCCRHFLTSSKSCCRRQKNLTSST